MENGSITEHTGITECAGLAGNITNMKITTHEKRLEIFDKIRLSFNEIYFFKIPHSVDVIYSKYTKNNWRAANTLAVPDIAENIPWMQLIVKSNPIQ